MPNCPQCGARNPRENTVCRSCGAVLGVEQPTAEVSPTPEWSDQAMPAEETAAPTEVQLEEELADSAEETPEEGEEGYRCIRCQADIAPGEALLIPARARGRSAALCPNCTAEVEAQFAAETQDVQLARGALFGLAAAIVLGVIWYFAETLSGYTLAPLAFVAGWLIAEAVRFGAGRKRGRQLQWIALGLTALVILGAQYAILGEANPIEFFRALGEQLADLFTLLLYGLGLWQAYTTPAPRRLIGARREQ